MRIFWPSLMPLLTPLFFALHPALSLYAANLNEFIPLSWVARAVFIMTTAAWALIWIVYWVVRDLDRASSVVSLLLFLSFAYRPAYNALNAAFCGEWVRHRNVMGLFLIVFVAACAGIVRLREPRRLQRGMRVFGLLLCVTACAQLASVASFSPRRESTYPQVAAGSRAEPDPDIYLIILDGHPRGDYLLSRYGIDNSSFLAGLESRGFRIARRSRSNYTYTIYSVASMLNMCYMSGTGEVSDGATDVASLRLTPHDHEAWHTLLRSNALTRFLKGRSYRTATYRPYPCSIDLDVDLSLDAAWLNLHLNDYDSILIAQTPFNQLLAPWLSGHLPRNASLHGFLQRQLASLPKLIAVTSPKFVFLHFLLPHKPFIFDRNGGLNVPSMDGNDISRYAEHVAYSDRMAEETVDRILESPHGRAAAILLISDHGNRWHDEDNRDFFYNLVAVRLPDGVHNDLPEEITLVNLFRFILNRLFDARLPFLEDRFFRHTPDLRRFYTVEWDAPE